jgi:trimeric autotransporter adhesin
MNEGTWILNGVDPAARDRAAEEAARRGLSLSDYLTNVILSGALAGRQPEADQFATDSDEAAGEAPDGWAVRHRLSSLKRRLGSVATSLDGAIDALDTSLADISTRVGDVETLAGDAANTLRGAMRDMAADIAAVRRQVSTVEDSVASHSDANAAAHADLAAACVSLGQRVDAADAAARNTDAAVASLTRTQEAFKRAVADEFDALVQESASRLEAGLSDVRAAADAAAAQAQAAEARTLAELRELRGTLEGRLAESAAETRARMQAAFADTAEQFAALTDRVADCERANARTVESVRMQIADVEDAAQSALEETAESLRQADAALAANLARAQHDAFEALAAARGAFAEDIAALERQHADGMARLSQVDAALAETTHNMTALQEALERRIAAAAADTRADLATTQEDWNQCFDAMTARLADDARAAEEVRHALRAETERVEACTLAALEKLGRDIAAGGAAVEVKLQQAARATDAKIERLDGRLADEADDLRNQQADMMDRLDLLNGAVSALAAGAAPTNERLTRLERAQEQAEIERAGSVRDLLRRVADLEQRQADAFEALHTDIARFLNDNDSRLASLETGVAALDPQHVAEEFADLRVRIEERILAVEQRSVRMLEQVAETVVLLDKRLNAGADQAARSA